MKTFLKEFPSLLVCGILGFLIAYMCTREIDKDEERICGMQPVQGKPADCVSWWESNGITVPEDIKNPSAHSEASDEDAE